MPRNPVQAFPLFQRHVLATAAEDLVLAAASLAEPEYPGLAPEDIQAQVATLAEQAQMLAGRGANAETRLRTLRRVMFQEERFRGNHSDYNDPRNSFLNEVVKRKAGIPISLSVILIGALRRLGLKTYGIGLPGHFMAAVALPSGNEVILDAFAGGAETTREECIAKVAAMRPERRAFDSATLFEPATHVEIIARMLRNLKAIYTAGGELERALYAAERLTLVEPGNPHELLDRAKLYFLLDYHANARADAETYLARHAHLEGAREMAGLLRRIDAAAAEVN